MTNTIHLSGRGWVLAVLAASIVLTMVTGVVELRRQRSNRVRPLRTATSAILERVAAEIMQLESKIDEFVRDLGPHHLATMALRDSRDEAREVMASMRANDVREAKPTPVRVESDDRGVDLLALQAIGAITLALPTVLPIGHVLTTWSLNPSVDRVGSRTVGKILCESVPT